ncbi:MAG: amidase [Acidisphaera sp.]|nr:amidase [Acidisphaera sp.]
MHGIREHATALAEGRLTARALVERCLDRIAAAAAGPVFLTVYAAQARAMADAADALRRAGRAASPFAGIPISLKDLFDVAGEPTPAASRALADAPPAGAHATVVARVLAAGFVPVGRTNMTEFAFSGLGINPHHGTPLSPWQRERARVPGGSSSGAAVAVADGMALGSLGTDTGGSCRVPAAFCGIVGYKPTARRVPLDGVLPLSPSLDSVGPLAGSVDCCAILDAVLAGAAPTRTAALPVRGLRLAVPENVVLEEMDETAAAAFERALERLAEAGALILHCRFAALDEVAGVNALGGLAAAEAFAWHKDLLAAKAALYDPRVRARIERGARQTAADYIGLRAARGRLVASLDMATAPYDALLMPTVPVVPPRIADLEEDGEYNRVNMLVLRNTALGNFFDRCAISLPCHAPGEAPVGLMLVGETMGDARLFAVATAVERVLAQD